MKSIFSHLLKAEHPKIDNSTTNGSIREAKKKVEVDFKDESQVPRSTISEISVKQSLDPRFRTKNEGTYIDPKTGESRVVCPEITPTVQNDGPPGKETHDILTFLKNDGFFQEYVIKEYFKNSLKPEPEILYKESAKTSQQIDSVQRHLLKNKNHQFIYRDMIDSDPVIIGDKS